MSLLDRTKGVPEEILRQIPIEEMRLIVSGQDGQVSERTRQIIEDGRRERSTFSEALDVVTSIGGGIAGGAAGGAFAGPVGAVVGGVLGGAAGAFGGTVAEDIIDDRNVDAERAAVEAAKSIAFDVGSGLAFSTARRVGKLFGVGAKTVAETNPAKNILEEIDVEDLAPEISTPRGRQMSQAALTEGVVVDGQRVTSSLNVQQTRNASDVQKVQQDIADLGLFSRGQQERRDKNTAIILKEKLKRLAGGQSIPPTRETLGENMFKVINGAKNALITKYNKDKIDLIQKLPKRITVPSNLARRYFEDAIAQGATIKQVGKIDKVPVRAETRTVLKKVLEEIPEDSKLSMSAIIGIEDSLRTRLADVFEETVSVGAQREARKQLASFNDTFRTDIAKIYEAYAPGTKKELDRIAKEFSEDLNLLLPEDIDMAVIKADSKKNYEDIGQTLGVLSGVDATDSITAARQYMKSLETAYKKLGKDELPANLSTYEAARDYIKEGYIANKIAPIIGEEQVQGMTSMLKGFDNAEKVGHAKVVLGDKTYANLKNVINIIRDATFEERTGILSLAFKSRELTAMTQVGGVAYTGGTLGSLVGASGILGIPYIMGKIINNPKAINRLLFLEKETAKNPRKYEKAPELALSAFMKVIEELNDRQKVDIQQYMLAP